jgi:hypothetical protein
VDGITHLRRARKELASPGSRRVRLRLAVRELWRGLFNYEAWPPRLQSRAADLVPRLYRGGATDDAVLNASDGTVEALSDEIEAFCEEAEACDLGGASDIDDPETPPASEARPTRGRNEGPRRGGTRRSEGRRR